MNKPFPSIDAQTAGQLIPKAHFEANMRQPRDMPDLAAWLKETTEWIEMENRANEAIRHRKWLKNIRFYEGRQLGYISNYTGRWVDVDPKPGDPYYINNQYRYFVKSITKEWVRSNAEMLVNAKSDDPKQIGKARIARVILQDYQRKIWTADLRQTESKHAVLNGNYFRYTYWSAAAGQMMDMPIYENRTMAMGDPSYYCPACGSEGYLDQTELEMGDQFPTCPDCGADGMEVQEPEQMNVPVQTGSQPIMSGDVVTEVVDPMEIKLHMHARRLEDSPYLRRKRIVLREIIEAAYPWVEYPLANPSAWTSLHYQEDLELSPGNVSVGGIRADYAEAGTGINQRMVEFSQFWLEPVLYGSYAVSKDEELANGTVLPAGTALRDLFPDGLYIAMVGQTVVDLRGENKGDHWCHGVYDLIPSRIWGDGTEDSVEQQRQLNEIDSLIIENIMNCDAPMTIYNPLKIKRGQISGKPREVVPLNNATLSDEPAKYFWQPNPRPLPPEVPMKSQQIKQDMQSQFGSFAIETGIPDANVKTATGMSIVRDAAVSMLGVPLELKSAVDVRWANQVLKLVQKNWIGERYIPLMGQYGQPEGQWFAESDIDGEFEITVRQHSWMPRNELELRNDILEALVAGGVPFGIFNPQFPPDAKALVAQRLNIPFDADRQSADARKQRLEIDKIKMAVDVAMTNMIDPIMFAAEQVAVEPLVDDHMTHVETVRAYLKTDQGDAEPMEIRAALLQHLQMHMQAKMQLDMEMAMMMGAMMPQDQAGGPPGQPGAGPPQQGQGGKNNAGQRGLPSGGAGESGGNPKPGA